MTKSILDLEPKLLWKHFDDICKIYRESGHEEKIRDFIVDFASGLGLTHRRDEKGNLVIYKNASNSQSTKAVILQAHIDMVCVKAADHKHDFTKDPIVPVVDGEWVTAEGPTTLGADDGMSIAAYMAIMESSDFTHGPLEFLFTVEEETGLHGATALDAGMLHGDILINTDSEEDGYLTIGCAGEETLLASIPFVKEAVPGGMEGMKIRIRGLRGGHSGMEIVKQRANAIKLMARILKRLDDEVKIRLVDFDGGVRRNAIADRATAVVSVKGSEKEKAIGVIEKCQVEMKREYAAADEGLEVIHEDDDIKDVIKRDDGCKAIDFVDAIYDGVVKMSDDMPGLVQTSTNVGVVNCDGDRFDVTVSTRSAVESEKVATNGSIRSLAALSGVEVKTTTEYPGWKPNVNSKLLELTKKTHAELFGKVPEVIAVHAGLECGIIGDKKSGMDMISYGPEIQGAHSTDERVEIKSVEKFYRLTLKLLESLA